MLYVPPDVSAPTVQYVTEPSGTHFKDNWPVEGVILI